MAKKPFKKKFTKNQTPKETPDYDMKRIKAIEEKKSPEAPKDPADGVRLNKHISNSGICSRREADQLIADGKIKVNKKVVTEMGYKVMPKDEVYYEGKPLTREKLVYVLLNKPKGFLTTMDDPKERKTVMELIKTACEERIYPVGRLDRNTTGLLLFTNDGELAKKLTHPSHKVRKIYQVELDKPIEEKDFLAIEAGLTLEDGAATVEKIAVLTPDMLKIGVEVITTKNRIVKRIFEHLGYDVVKLDRTIYGGLTKKNLTRGRWRYLTEREVISLKHFK